MDLIEQAVFTSAETDRQAGYQVVAASPGVADADLRELGIWGPSHDALCDPSPHAVSLNFHPLPSGAFCVGRTVPAGWEYSGRGGRRVYTQCLIVPPPLLTRFANNPFAVLRAATAAGAMRLYQQVPSRLEPVRLAGRAAAVNEALLERLASFPGPAWMAALVQAALGSKRVGVAGGPPGEQVLAGLLNCLPPPWRTQFPFCTGLRISPRRPFRLMALDGGPDDLRRIERLHGMTVLDLSGPPPAGLVPADGWARAIHRVMEMGRIAVLSAWLSRRCPPTVNDRELALLARQLLDDLEAAAPAGQNPHSPPADADSRPRVEAEPTEREPCSDGSGKLAHPAHRPRQSAEASSPAAGARPPGPSVLFHPEDRAILDKLEHLDDLVYDAIAGREEAMAQLRALWPQLRDELGEPLLAESREQYLRYGLSIWQDYLRPAGLPDPARALHSLDVLCLLFDEA